MALLRALRESLVDWWRWQTKDGWTQVDSTLADPGFNLTGFGTHGVYIETWRNDRTGEIRYDHLIA